LPPQATRALGTPRHDSSARNPRTFPHGIAMTTTAAPERRQISRSADPMADRMTSGNTEADYILSGGFPLNSINIIMGHPGSGKTIFAEQLMFHNASEDRPVLYLTTLSEPLAKVIRYLQGFSFFDENKFGSQVIYEDDGEQLA